MLRRFLRTTGQLSLVLGVVGVGWWMLHRSLRPRPCPSAGGKLAPAAAGIAGLVIASRSLRSRRKRADHLVARATPKPSYFLSRWFFLRLLGVVYLAAFVSLWMQIKGLVGRRGILPVVDYLEEVRRQTGRERYRLVPTLCWLDASDRGLDRLCAGGVILSGLLILGIAPALVLLLLWTDYLSLSVACQRFLGYQWDALLLETGLHAAFFAPWRLWPRLGREPPPPRLALWLLRWLLFRLMFTSGMVKLLSGDPTWRKGTAVGYHYETQPLPAWTSWYMHQLPTRFHQLSTWFTFAVELGLPPLMFGPRFYHQVACAGTVLLQLLIAATGNFGFFNLLTTALCIPLLDDRCFPKRWQSAASGAYQRPGESYRGVHTPRSLTAHRRWLGWLILPVAALMVTLSGLEFLTLWVHRWRWPRWLSRVREVFHPFRSLNTYGLFAVMTTSRPEILIEGSNDGHTWLAYEFKWKPGDVRRRPVFTGLHMPRLDWQMWFAALGHIGQNSWLLYFLVRLLEGSPEVLGLLHHNPFPDAPPRYVRAVLYDYRFTDRATRKETGAWWQRKPLGLYCPILALAKNESGWF
jgi:hypothetical protein